MIVALTSLFVLGPTAHAQDRQCLHRADESAGDRSRRHTAVAFVAAVNAAQARHQREAGAYASLGEIKPAGNAPLGFVPRLILNPFGYAIKVVDTLDPCGFAVFSDERGVVFEAHPTAIELERGEPHSPSAVQPKTSDDRHE
jgi:hypothetical protein